MNRQKLILLAIALGVIGIAAAFLGQMKAHQRLGSPGVKTRPLAGGPNLEVLLPERVLDLESIPQTQAEVVTNILPPDTSFGQRLYFKIAGKETNSQVLVNVVLMGADRTSIHKPQYCLEAAGWHIDDSATLETTIPVPRPQPYSLPVIRLWTTREVSDANGRPAKLRGLYVYWFVADGVLSGDKSGKKWMWGMAKHMFETGELQRWAYVSCFTVCTPGHEDVTYERMKQFIVAAVPEFQLTPKPNATVTAAAP